MVTNPRQQWMLFCQPKDVDEVWRVVARATANNELGVAAKVAPWNPHNDPTGRKDRIVCVYTADFSDKADVTRVLQKLRELRLVEAMGRPIYYKPGAIEVIDDLSLQQQAVHYSIQNQLGHERMDGEI
ncbi:uncharacterized protein ColSpa_08610 [Colletotrichum spaethianum]|uniref:DUF1917 domain-containing protein n=1 Tax=Colletotrichum spaethianum TaxID=700344 RepID=A0AA37PA30_9PEZI|nr:uncharacterized protein ColSpa_08610 [Colletotrichum spaethianum]GKT48429.1 hypothetical protein ColSpa_08610 [Colletotrichum spaethianum]